MNEKNGKNYPVKRLRPDYEFWADGIYEGKKGWINTGLAFLKSRNSYELIVLGAILALWRIAHELVQRDSCCDLVNFFGCLVIATMILAIALMTICKTVKQANVKESRERQKETPKSNIRD